VVTSFNDAINAHNLDRLAAILTETHRFVDSAGERERGR
jgi:hypothetical protein